MIGWYNAFQLAAEFFELRPNQERVAKYGSRNYLVTVKVDEGSYSCDYCKMDRDGILCCHILRVFTHIEVDVIPKRYIIRPWTPSAAPSAPPSGYQQPNEMPPESKKQLKHANMMIDFQKLAKFASASDAATAIVGKHMHVAHTEICHLNKSRKKKRTATAVRPSDGGNPQGPAQPPAPTDPAPPPAPMGRAPPAAPPGPTAPTEPTSPVYHSDDRVPRDPPRSTTKGKARSRRF